MKYRALTVSGEFGSGGVKIAHILAEWLGWKLLDEELILAIARAAHVDKKVVSSYDERPESWLRRFHEQAVRGVAMATGQRVDEEDIFDAREMVTKTRRIVEEAHDEGNCVIVGRGSQCLLHSKPDTFHLFVYAPLRERMERLKTTLEPGTDIAERMRVVDDERCKYLQQQFGKQWRDPHLYSLMIRSHADLDAAARVVLYAVTGKSQVSDR